MPFRPGYRRKKTYKLGAQIDLSLCTPIANPQLMKNLSQIWNGTTAVNSASCAYRLDHTFAQIGMTFPTPKRIAEWHIWGSSDQGYVHLSDPKVAIDFYGQTPEGELIRLTHVPGFIDAPRAQPQGADLLETAPETVPQLFVAFLVNITTPTVSGNGNFRVAELDVYEAV